MMMMTMNKPMMTVGTVQQRTSTTGSSSVQDGTMSTAVRTASSAPLWRPWTSVRRNKAPPCPYSRPAPPPSAPGCSDGQMKPHNFQHPVRLMWPRSKTFDFLYSDGATLLKNFPVQATICFYEESDSEDDSDDDEEEVEEEDEGAKAPRHHFTSRN